MLTDTEIFATFVDKITPFDIDRVQPNSYDVALGENISILNNGPDSPRVIDPSLPNDGLFFTECLDEDGFELGANQFILGTTLETITMPDDMVGFVEGKSSLARLGLIPHCAAGLIDSGFVGQVTLEIKNLADRPILLRPKMLIAQISFFRCATPAMFPYGHPRRNSKYQGQQGPTTSKYYHN